MKKLFSAFTAVLLAFCFISCAPQELSDRSSKNEGSVSLSIRSPRTISPAEGISYKDVDVWNVTFRDTTESHLTKYDDIDKTVSFIGGSGSQEIRLPVGTYDVIFEGSVTNPEKDSVVPFYGKDSVTVVGGTTVPISVFVAPKKSEGGTGSFNFTVTTSGFQDYPPSTDFSDNSIDDKNYFTVSLTPYGGENPVATWTPTEISSSAITSETGDIYSFSVSSATLESQSVPSGFYTLSIKYTWVVGEDSVGQLLTKTKEIYSPYHDFLVEIIDGLTTNGSADIKVSLEESKTYYATTDATKAKGNGAFASMPGYLDDVLAAIKDTTISTANIIMVDSLDADGRTTIYPEIDVSKVNATGMWYEISVLTSEGGQKHCYSIKDEDGDGNPTIYTEVDTVNLKDSFAAGKTVDVYNIVELKELHLSLKNNTSVAIKFVVQGSVILDEIDSFDYYSTHPFMTAEYPIPSLELSSTLASYTTASKTINASEYEYYILPAVQANPIINGFAYDLVVTKDDKTVTDTQFYVGDTVKITATSKSEGGSFAEGTTFAWFINDKKTDCTAQSYTIKFGEGDAVAENTIICLVGYGTEYSTAQITLTAVENTVVLYNNTLDTAKSALSYAILKESSILYPSELIASDGRTQIKDFCFDASNNMYALVYDGINYSINKYAYNNGYSTSGVTTYTCSDTGISTINNIETSDTGDLYAVIYARDDNAGYADYIAKLTLQNLTEGTDGTIVFDYYASPISWTENGNSYNIYTFCIDGTNLYVIPYIYSSDYSTTEIKLVSCTVSDMQLTENKNASITLDYAENGQESITTVFSGYNDSLEYRDLCYINGKLYLLVRDVELSTSSYDSTLYSRGALCTFIVSDSGITAEKIDTGYQKTSSSFSYTGSYETETSSYPTITRTTYFGDGSLTFYGPVKFIARKEDELIIADDGYSVTEEDYASTEGHKQGTVSSKNAVVTYNLNTESLNFVSLDGEYFEEKYSGYFYSSGFYATNQ